MTPAPVVRVGTAAAITVARIDQGRLDLDVHRADCAANALDSFYFRRAQELDLLGDVNADGPSIGAILTLAAETVGGPVNILATGGFGALDDAHRADPAEFRQKVARLFLVGGQVNDYANGIERVPIDPRLKERHPERFAPGGDPLVDDPAALGRLLTCGEAVIWLPRDICLWRYAAPQLLEDAAAQDPEIVSLLATLANAVGAEMPVLLSTLPAFCLAANPDLFLWLRLFRTVAARIVVDADSGRVTDVEIGSAKPNAFLVVAIDSAALSARLTAVLKGTS